MGTGRGLGRVWGSAGGLGGKARRGLDEPPAQGGKENTDQQKARRRREKEHRSNQQTIASRINMSGLASKAQGRGKQAQIAQRIVAAGDAARQLACQRPVLGLIALPQY